ncbi:cytochrome b [Brevundimonas sp.]|uniref:cytochrome b n=1 Tax=Brevundimonas sp. TaxID=1871086 RepID=UPI002FD9B980
MAQTRDRYSTIAVILHWGIALAILAQVLLITAHEATEGPMSREFVNVHKALGITILLATLVRIGWRIANPPPPLPQGMKPWEKTAARAAHLGFYALLLIMPLTGWAAMSARPRDIDFWGLFQWPLLPLTGADDDIFMQWHEWGMKAVYVLLALHVLAALKHHFVDRDGVLRSMLPFLPRR